MPTIDCGHWNGRRNRLPHLAASIVWQSRWGRRFRQPVEADFHLSSKSRKRLICTPARCSRGDGVILQDRRMNSRRVLWRFGCGLALIGAVFAFQRPFRVYPSMEPYDDVPLPPDFQEKAEWVFGRLMYPQHPYARFGRYSRRYGGAVDWREGGTSWTQDY